MSTVIPKAQLHATFHDKGDEDYDKIIEAARKKMKDNDPTASLREVSIAISVLKNMRDGYRVRPCFEGYCWGIFTPHRSRIDRRIQALENEKTIFHEPNSQAFESSKIRLMQNEHERNLTELQLKAAREYSETEKNEKTVKGFRPKF